MYKGMYIALSGALLKQRHMDISAQNMANAATTGYKKERISFKEYLIPVDNKPQNVSDGRAMSQLSDIKTDYSNGSLIKTGNTLDVAINGKGFFALEGNLYTRNGNFMIDNEGNLITHNNAKVLGDGGPITVQEGNIVIDSSGEIFVDNISLGKLQVVDFQDKRVLEKRGDGIFLAKDQGEEIEANVSQGFLESSNVEIVREMVQMISTLREFETYQKMIHAFDEATAKVINELGGR